MSPGAAGRIEDEFPQCYPTAVSNVHRLRVTDCIFFVNVNLRPRIKRFNESEYDLLIRVLEA